MRVLELGCGAGLPGIYAWREGGKEERERERAESRERAGGTGQDSHYMIRAFPFSSLSRRASPAPSSTLPAGVAGEDGVGGLQGIFSLRGVSG